MAPWRQAVAAGAEPKAIVPAATQGSSVGTANALAVLGHDTLASQGTATGSALPLAPKRKQVSVTEMLEYVKGLNIDPIKEADMLWIAEEAFNAALPPGWSEHQDDQGRVYFHNGSTGESTWRHPMDDLFREIVDYQRRVVKAGGFWQVEDEIAELEENIRLNLADWMELYDEHGEKFFYNRKNDESRFDDPRMAVYHSLYARIKLVAKMKERLPVLARAPRPEEPTEHDILIKQRIEEEEKKYLAYLIKIQSFARVILAKRKVRLQQALRTVQKGPQPLRGKLRLRMEKLGPGGAKELVLSQTTGHRRNRAATKIQARVRGMLARKKFRPLVMHRTYLSKVATKIQATARVWLAKRRSKRVREERFVNAGINIQRVYRGYRDRQYVSALRAEKLRFEWMMKCIIIIQSGMRMHLAYKEFKRRRYHRFSSCIVLIKKQTKVYQSRCDLHRQMLEQQPITAELTFTTDPKSRGIVPFSWNMWATPQMFDKEPTRRSTKPMVYANLFATIGPHKYKDMAATKIQSRARVMVARRRKKLLQSIAEDFFMEVFVNLEREIDERQRAAVGVQKMYRGRFTRRHNTLAEKKAEQLSCRKPQIQAVQAYMRRFFAQEWLHMSLQEAEGIEKATRIQAHWRGWLARRHVEQLREQALWPMKGWFEYTATGRDMVHLEVRFLPNPGFDDYKYFEQNGCYDELDLSVEEVEDVIARVLRGHPDNALETPPGSKAPSAAEEPRSQGASRPGSGVGSLRSFRNELGPDHQASGSRRPSRAGSRSLAGSLAPPSVVPSQSPSRMGSRRVSHAGSAARSHADGPQGPDESLRSARDASKSSSLARGKPPSSVAEGESECGSVSPARSPAPGRRRSSVRPSAIEKVAPRTAEREAPLEELHEEASPEAAAASPERPPSLGGRRNTLQGTPGGKVIRRPSRAAKASPTAARSSPKSNAPSESAEGHPSEPAGSTPTSADPAAEAAPQPACPSGEQPKEDAGASAVGVVTIAVPETLCPSRKSTLEYSQGSSGEGEEFGATSKSFKPKARDKHKRRPQQERRGAAPSEGPTATAGLAATLKPHKKSPQQTRERSPITAQSVPSLAQSFLAEAPLRFVDKAPPRHPDDEPKPPQSKMPTEPPAPSPTASAKDLSASNSAAVLRAAQANAGPMKRKTYGGTLEGGKFIRTAVGSVEELSPEEKQAVLTDLLETKKRREQELAEKQKLHKARRKKEEALKSERMNANMGEAEDLEQERQRRKVKELKKWLKKKEEETKARKARDAEMLQLVMEKESKKSETLQKMERDRLAQRERRLRHAELQRAQLEAKLLLSNGATQKHPGGGAAMKPSADVLQSPMAMQVPGMMQAPGMMHPPGMMQAPPNLGAYWQEQQHWQQPVPGDLQQQLPSAHALQQPTVYPFSQPLRDPQQPSQNAWPVDSWQQQLPQQAQLEQVQQMRASVAATQKPAAQRVVHRHIHHHVHYHDGSDPDSGGEHEQQPMPMNFPGSPEQQRQIEMASEARVRAQLEAGGPESGLGQARGASVGSLRQPGLGAAEGGPSSPPMQRSASFAAGQGHGLGLGRTQEMARHGSLPALDMDLGRRQGLARYAGSVQRAMGSYADSGRPRLARPVAMA